jgi:hypothetical protein
MRRHLRIFATVLNIILGRLRQIIWHLLHRHHHHRNAVTIAFRHPFLFWSIPMSSPALLDSTQQVPVSIAFLDANGAPAKVTNITLVPGDPSVIGAAFTAPYDSSVPAETAEITVQGLAAGNSALTVHGTNPDGSVVSGSQDFAVSAVAPAPLPATQVVFTVGTPVPKA